MPPVRPATRACPDCLGRGVYDNGNQCSTCLGTGNVPPPQRP
jgi:DnaJ-class molecular chaperone